MRTFAYFRRTIQPMDPQPDWANPRTPARHWHEEILGTYTTIGILVADQLFKTDTGLNPIKTPNIIVRISK